MCARALMLCSVHVMICEGQHWICLSQWDGLPCASVLGGDFLLDGVCTEHVVEATEIDIEAGLECSLVFLGGEHGRVALLTA